MPNFQNPLDALQQFINARQLPMIAGGMQYAGQPQAPLPFFTTFQDRLRARQRQQQNTPRFQPARGDGFAQVLLPRSYDQQSRAFGLNTSNRPRPQTY